MTHHISNQGTDHLVSHLRSSSVSNRICSRDMTAHLPGSGRRSIRSSRRTTRMRRWHSRVSRGWSRLSMATPTPASMSTARRSTSCTEAPGTLRLGPSSIPYAGWWQRLHLCQGWHPTTTGWRRQSALMPPTALRTWQEPGSSRWSSPRPSLNLGCTTS
jgi:hypothetical protein